MKNKFKIIISLIIGIIVGTIGYVVADNIINANQVGYSNPSKTQKTNVQDSIDELYLMVKATMVDTFWPIGSIYITVENINPSVKFGGTWVEFGAGRTLVGIGTGKDKNNTTKTFKPNEMDGEYSHQLTVSEMPSHQHAVTVTYVGSGSGSGNYIEYNNTTQNGTLWTSSKGGDGAHNNLQPYITVYMWKRTA